MSLDRLLVSLSDGEFHSGAELGGLLNVSRTAIWKQLKKVESLGIPLESVKGKGYCIPGGLDLLSLEKVQESLSSQAGALLFDLDIHNVIESTNQHAMTKAVAGVKGYACTAEQQTMGRGRRGKRWVSPYGCNLYLSVVWEFAGGAAALEGLSLAVGVAVTEALQKAGINDVQLKWPNDVLYCGQKLAGILLEMAGDAAGPCQVVIGIGLNVAMPKAEGVSIDQPWIDVASINQPAANRNTLLALLLNELIPLLSTFEKGGFANYRERWMQLDAFANRDVNILLGSELILGRAVGVNKSGAIQLQTAAGLRDFSGGEISLRLREDGCDS